MEGPSKRGSTAIKSWWKDKRAERHSQQASSTDLITKIDIMSWTCCTREPWALEFGNWLTLGKRRRHSWIRNNAEISVSMQVQVLNVNDQDWNSERPGFNETLDGVIHNKLIIVNLSWNVARTLSDNSLAFRSRHWQRRPDLSRSNHFSSMEWNWVVNSSRSFEDQVPI